MKQNGKAIWIAVPGKTKADWRAAVLPAPYFRKSFACNAAGKAEIHICGLGYYELYLNGEKVGDHVLDPVVTQYDKRAHYVTYDVSSALRPGENVLGVILGNGWYNCHTPEAWHFDKAVWLDYPKLLLELEVDGQMILGSDTSWKTKAGPIVFDGLRNGETYDARLELGNWLATDYDDQSWQAAAQVMGPGGVVEPQTMPPCKVMQTLPAAQSWTLDNGDRVYDIGQNMVGWARIAVSGAAGTEVILKYGERLKDRAVDQDHIGCFIKGGDFQTDRYILKGDGVEVWEPRFTYHGFQYVSIRGAAEIHKVEGRVVHTAFPQIGRFECSNPILQKLQTNTVWSYIGNFVGIPTDCPHREKNGWMGDANLAAETGLYNFAAGSSYNQWMETIADAQRPNGQLPGIVPTSGWGYNWGSGPAWDSAFILIPWYVYLYDGDTTAIHAHYDAMKRYVDFCSSMATDHIVSFGLGDWCHVDGARMADPAVTSTAYYYVDVLTLAKFAGIAGRRGDQAHYETLAADIKQAFNKRFYRGDGIYAKGEMMALGCALYQGLVEDSQKAQVVAKLVEAVEASGCKIDFGILGAKYVPRALAAHGHVALAYRMFSQTDFPGWGHWITQGATTLWEAWIGDSSLNHIMFGDISAWMYQYLAGIAPDPEIPGFKHILLAPHPVPGLDWVKAQYDSPQGRISSAWTVKNNQFNWEVEIPPHSTATVLKPDGQQVEIGAGFHHFKCLCS
jgi:alpha-L-rhamnosidase